MDTVAVFTLVTGHLQVDWLTLLFGGVCSILSFVSFYAMLLGLRQGEASRIITLTRLGFVVTALLAILFLRETLTISKVLGLIAAMFVVGLYSYQSLEAGNSLSKQVLWLALVAICWSKIKTILRTAKARTLDELMEALKVAFSSITESDALAWFVHCGYPVNP